MLLDAGGSRTGVLGSLGARYGAFHDPGNGLTTPAPVELHRALRGLREAGADTAIMEVTSHALRMDRVRGLSFGGGLIAAIMPGSTPTSTGPTTTTSRQSGSSWTMSHRRGARLRRGQPRVGCARGRRARRRARRSSLEPAAPKRARSRREGGGDAAVQLREIVLDHTGARFVCVVASEGHAGAAGHRMHSPLLGPGHLRNVALAVAYATAAGVPPSDAAAALSTLVPLRRRMERYEAAGRAVLDDTAAHAQSFRATFQVADLLAAGRAASHGRCRIAVVYAIRGRRGVDIDRRNAEALAELLDGRRIASAIVTAALDVSGEADRATAEEIDAAREAFREHGVASDWHDTLRAAIRAAAAQTGTGDLIVLIGAQGMNEGKRILLKEARLWAFGSLVFGSNARG